DRRACAKAYPRSGGHHPARPVRAAASAAQGRGRQPRGAGHGVLERHESLKRKLSDNRTNASLLATPSDSQEIARTRERTMSRSFARHAALLAGAALLIAGPASAQTRHFKFGYDQPHTTGYGIVGDVFAAKLKELSKGTMLIDQYPGAQLGQEPQMLQLVKSGDIDFIISSSANAATIAPEAGVMSLHFLFRSEDHLIKSIASPELSKAVRSMVEETVKGAHALAVTTLGLRNMYSKKEVHKIDDIKGWKIRVQATPTEDTMFPAYGAQVVHMPFGSVYTSLQTGVVDAA